MTIPTGLTILDVAKAAVDLATDNPKFVYTGPCEYFAGREFDEEGEEIGDENARHGDCLFGQAFEKVGVSPDDVEEDVTVDAVLAFLFGDEVAVQNAVLVNAMCTVQASQDKQVVWGEAIEPLAQVIPTA